MNSKGMSMECHEIQQLMSSYLDQELNTEQALQAGEHIAGCTACMAALEQMEALQVNVRTHASHYAAPTGLRSRILANVAQKRPSKLRNWPWAWINLGLAGLSAAAFAATLVLYLGQPSPSQTFDDEVLSSHFRSLAPGHLLDVVSSDQHTVKPWYAGKLDFSPAVVDLSVQGYPLLGGRIDYLAGRPVAAMAYQRHKHIVNLYLFPDATGKPNDIRLDTRRGYQLAQWNQAGMRHIAVSDMNGDELKQFVSLWQLAAK